MNLYVSKNYTNHEAFCQDSFRWNMDFNKLSKGSFCGAINLIDIGDVQIGEIKLNSVLIQKGISPIGYRTFVIPADNLQSFSWLNKNVNAKDLLMFSNQGELSATSFDNFHYYMVSIKNELLQNIIQKYSLVNFEKALSNDENVFRINGSYFSHIQEYISVCFKYLRHNTDLINSESFQYKIRDKLPFLILSFMNSTRYSKVSSKMRKRDKALQRCIDFIDNNNLLSVSVPRLVEVSQMSERTIQLAFIERYGLTPIEFINHIKLNEVRTHLIRTSKHKISDIAKRVGFNHLGQFSAAYNKLFNELPRDTVKKVKAGSF